MDLKAVYAIVVLPPSAACITSLLVVPSSLCLLLLSTFRLPAEYATTLFSGKGGALNGQCTHQRPAAAAFPVGDCTSSARQMCGLPGRRFADRKDIPQYFALKTPLQVAHVSRWSSQHAPEATLLSSLVMHRLRPHSDRKILFLFSSQFLATL